MCVICYVPKDAYLPSKETIRNMWNRNHDGAGVMYKDEKNDVYFKKGYFDFETFYADLLDISTYAKEMAIHCRIATSGGVNEEMCHPFPLTKNVKEIKSVKGEKMNKPMIMHNGVISIVPKNNLNDTCTYIMDKLFPRYKKSNAFMFDNNVVNRIQNEIGSSKLLIMSQYPTKMIGNWQKDDDGCYYSNLYFKPYDYSKYYTSTKKYNNKYDLFDDCYETIYSRIFSK